MPQASDAQRKVMARWFPICADGSPNKDGIDDGRPYLFLLSRGYTEKAGMWSKPTPSHTVSVEELECLLFLRDEWDYDYHKPLYRILPSEEDHFS